MVVKGSNLVQEVSSFTQYLSSACQQGALSNSLAVNPIGSTCAGMHSAQDGSDG